MADVYVKLAKSVDKMLARYGKDCLIIHSIPGAYDPGTGTVTPDVDVNYIGRAIEGNYELEHLAGTLIEAGNKVGVFKITDPSFAGDVTLQMKIQLEGDHRRNLREIQPVTPGPNCLYWKFVSGT